MMTYGVNFKKRFRVSDKNDSIVVITLRMVAENFK